MEPFYKSLVEGFVVVGVSSLSDLRPLPPIEGREVSYEPHLLDCIPENRREDSIIRDISLFCLPEGVVISDHHGSPQGATFVLTDEVGTHWYGTCLRFYDTIVCEDENCESVQNCAEQNSSSDIENFSTSIVTETTDTIVSLIHGSKEAYYKKKFEDEPHSSTDDDISEGNLHPIYGDLQKAGFIEKSHQNNPNLKNRTRSKAMSQSIEIEDISQQLSGTPIWSGDDSGSDLPREKSYDGDLHSLSNSNNNNNSNSNSSNNNPPNLEKTESFYCSKCLCILSKLPYFDFFHEYLTQVYTYVFKDQVGEGIFKKKNSIPIETFICNLVLEVPIPPPGIEACLRVFGPIKPLLLSKPPLNELPCIQFSVRTIFLCLDKTNIMTLLTAVLLEKQILFVSKNNNLLTIAAECMYNLTYPFYWKYVYIPVLPPNLIQCTEAPTPYIMGIDSQYLSWIDSSLSLVLVDLDNNIVKITGDALPSLPKKEVNTLLKELSLHIHPELSEIGKVYPYGKSIKTMEEIEREECYHERQIRLAFVEFFVSLFSGYRKYLSHTEPDGVLFDKENFLNSKLDDAKEFLSQFLETNIFYTFLLEGTTLAYGLFNELLKRFEDNVPVSELKNGFEYYSPHLEVIIPMNNPNETKYIGEVHRSFSFPRFKKEREFDAPRFQLLLKKIDLIMLGRTSHLPQLHLLKAQVLSYLALKDSFYQMQAVAECAEALKLNSDIVSNAELHGLLHLISLEELQKIAIECTIQRMKAIAMELHKEKMIEIEKAKKRQLELYEKSKAAEAAVAHIAPHKVEEGESEEVSLFELSDITSILALLRQSSLVEDVISRNAFLKILKSHKILSDDCSLSKVNKYLKSVEVNNTIPTPFIKTLLFSVEKVYEDLVHYIEIFHSLLSSREIPIFFGPVSTFSGTTGKLLLTSTRLILFKKKRNPRYHLLQDITTVEIFNYVIVFPPGVPCLKIHIPPRNKPYVYVFWNFALRDLWGTYILEIISAYKMSKTLSDTRLIDYAIQNIIFSEALQKRDKRRSSKAALTYFGRFYPSLGWFKIAQSLESKGMLNLNQEILIEGEINDAMGIITSLLDNIAQLFFEFVEKDGSNVNFVELKRSIRWEGFLQLSASLQKVDISKLTSQEKTLFFINLYNIIVIHAYVVCGGFPKSMLDWRYIETCSYYSLGGVAYSLGAIHHGILRGNVKAPWDYEIPFPSSDHRKEQLNNIIFDNRVLFLLSTHLSFSPSMFKLSLECLEASFRVASEYYCQEHVVIEGNTISLPIILCWYKEDFGGTINSVLKWVQSYLTTAKKKKLQSLLETSVYEVEWVEKWVPSPKPLLTGGMKVSNNSYNYSIPDKLNFSHGVLKNSHE